MSVSHSNMLQITHVSIEFTHKNNLISSSYWVSVTGRCPRHMILYNWPLTCSISQSMIPKVTSLTLLIIYSWKYNRHQDKNLFPINPFRSWIWMIVCMRFNTSTAHVSSHNATSSLYYTQIEPLSGFWSICSRSRLILTPDWQFIPHYWDRDCVRLVMWCHEAPEPLPVE